MRFYPTKHTSMVDGDRSGSLGAPLKIANPGAGRACSPVAPNVGEGEERVPSERIARVRQQDAGANGGTSTNGEGILLDLEPHVNEVTSTRQRLAGDQEAVVLDDAATADHPATILVFGNATLSGKLGLSKGISGLLAGGVVHLERAEFGAPGVGNEGEHGVRLLGVRIVLEGDGKGGIALHLRSAPVVALLAVVEDGVEEAEAGHVLGQQGVRETTDAEAAEEAVVGAGPDGHGLVDVVPEVPGEPVTHNARLGKLPVGVVKVVVGPAGNVPGRALPGLVGVERVVLEVEGADEGGEVGLRDGNGHNVAAPGRSPGLHGDILLGHRLHHELTVHVQASLALGRIVGVGRDGRHSEVEALADGLLAHPLAHRVGQASLGADELAAIPAGVAGNRGVDALADGHVAVERSHGLLHNLLAQGLGTEPRAVLLAAARGGDAQLVAGHARVRGLGGVAVRGDLDETELGRVKGLALDTEADDAVAAPATRLAALAQLASLGADEALPAGGGHVGGEGGGGDPDPAVLHAGRGIAYTRAAHWEGGGGPAAILAEADEVAANDTEAGLALEVGLGGEPVVVGDAAESTVAQRWDLATTHTLARGHVSLPSALGSVAEEPPGADEVVAGGAAELGLAAADEDLEGLLGSGRRALAADALGDVAVPRAVSLAVELGAALEHVAGAAGELGGGGEALARLEDAAVARDIDVVALDTLALGSVGGPDAVLGALAHTVLLSDVALLARVDGLGGEAALVGDLDAALAGALQGLARGA